jgi:AcrR family transcriptional regulator
MITDKRIIKTRTSIKKAFMTIMLDKDINKITVSDIAEKAMINRSTFYLHYADVSEVMVDIENEIANAISTCFDKVDVANVYESTYELLINMSATLEEMETMKLFILHSTKSKYIIEKLKDIFVERAMATLPFSKRNDKYYYCITFVASGIIDTYIKWSNNDSNKLTLDQLCRSIGELAEIASSNIEKVLQ